MAEVLGAVASGITVAGLTKLCLDAFEVIQVARKQGQDFEKLSLRLNIERARLHIWAQAIGLTGSKDDGRADRLHKSPFESLILTTLNLILRLFQDGEALQKKYGCAVCDEHLDRAKDESMSNVGKKTIEKLAEPFANFSIYGKRQLQKSSVKSKTRWIIRDREKFEGLIREVQDLIDGLQDITKSFSNAARQEGMMRYNIQQIKDTETLEFLSDVCQHDYPDISDAASIKIDVLTVATNERMVIEDWVSSVNQTFGTDGIDDLEQLTITELKELLWRERDQINSELDDLLTIVAKNGKMLKEMNEDRNYFI